MTTPTSQRCRVSAGDIACEDDIRRLAIGIGVVGIAPVSARVVNVPARGCPCVVCEMTCPCWSGNEAERFRLRPRRRPQIVGQPTVRRTLPPTLRPHLAERRPPVI